MVNAFLPSEMISMPVQYKLLKCDDDEAAKQASLHQVTPNEVLVYDGQGDARLRRNTALLPHSDWMYSLNHLQLAWHQVNGTK